MHNAQEHQTDVANFGSLPNQPFAGGNGAAAGGNSVFEMHQLLNETFNGWQSDQVDEESPAGACMRPLLAALEWAGCSRHLAEALPHFDRVHNVQGLRSVLEKINFESSARPIALKDVRENILPCLFEAKDASLMVIYSIDASGMLSVFDANTKEFVSIEPSDLAGTAYIFRSIDQSQQREENKSVGWIQALLFKFRKSIVTLFMLSFFVNFLALSLPVYIMTVYDKAIGTKSLLTLGSLFAGIAIIVTCELLLRVVRGRALTYLGTRVEYLIVSRVFQQLMCMPISMTENATIGSQLTRFKQFEGIRDLFSGALANALLDLPFLIVFIAAVFVIGGPLGFVPIGLIAVYCALAFFALPLVRANLRKAGKARSDRRSFLMEMTGKYRTLQDNSTNDVWLKRFEDINSKHMVSNFRAQQLSSVVQTVSQSLTMIAGTATLCIGTLMTLEGAMTMGALVATTALVWRGLSPLQSAFLGLNQIGTAVESFRQIDLLLKIPPEREQGALPSLPRRFEGKVSIHSAGLRYPGCTEPSLRGVSLKATKGELIAITGANGSGKSTLLKVIAGLYKLQVGAIQIDDVDIRQIDAAVLRQGLGYMPQKSTFIYGTIAQNIKLADPTATAEAIEAALETVGAMDEVRQLPDGIHTRLRGMHEKRFSSVFLRQIALARAVVKKSPIYLLDEPDSESDAASNERLIQMLKNMQGKTTVFLTTSRPDLIKHFDRVVVLEDGRVATEGAPKQVLPILLKQIAKAS